MLRRSLGWACRLGAASGVSGLEALLLTVLCVNVFTLFRFTRWGWFSCDDFQHAHLAWLTAQGKVIYRDFFDTHGPLFAWMNAAWIRVFGSGRPGFNLILSMRMLSFVALLGQGGLVFAIGRRLTGRRDLGLLAAALLLSSYLLHDSGTKLRPDAGQTLLLLAALLAVMDGRPWLAGLGLGLDLCMHLKGLAGAAALVGATLLVRAWGGGTLHHARPVRERHNRPGLVFVLKILVSALLVCGVCVAYFAWNNGLDALVSQVVTHNFSETADNFSVNEAARAFTRGRFWRWFLRDLPLVLLGLSGIAVTAGRIFSGRAGANVTLVALAALFSTPVWAFPLYPQVCLPTLPLLAAAALLPFTATPSPRGLLVGAAACAAVAGVVRLVEFKTSSADEARYRRELEFVLRNSDRKAPVLYVWPTVSPAFVFNANHSRLWMLPSDEVGGPRASLTDVDHWRTREWVVQEKLLQGEVEWLVVDDAELRVMEARVRDYIVGEYQRVGNVWRKRRPGTTRAGRDLRERPPARIVRLSERKAGARPSPAPTGAPWRGGVGSTAPVAAPADVVDPSSCPSASRTDGSGEASCL
ncbi:MAG: hypothetical protein RL199_153 [Pseudomonadota bacterium]|jgi:hypothetical protein